MKQTPHIIIGRATIISVAGQPDVPAKVDTGADMSCLWASNVREVGDELRCELFHPSSQYYTGKEIIFPAGSFRRIRIASSNGHTQARYAVKLPVIVAGQVLDVCFSLANRATMMYPILLGRDMLSGRFLVDTAQDIPAELERELKLAKRKRVHDIRQARLQTKGAASS